MVGCSICAFIVLVWLREQIVVHGGPDWLEAEAHPLHQMNLPRVARGWLGGVIGAVSIPLFIVTLFLVRIKHAIAIRFLQYVSNFSCRYRGNH